MNEKEQMDLLLKQAASFGDSQQSSLRALSEDELKEMLLRQAAYMRPHIPDSIDYAAMSNAWPYRGELTPKQEIQPLWERLRIRFFKKL